MTTTTMKRGALFGAALAVMTVGTEAARPRPDGPASADDQARAWEAHQSLEASSPWHGITWRDIGPVDQGGRIVDLATVPGEPYTWYVAYASGGLWKTTNGGGSFEPLFDDQPTMIMGDIAVDPNAPATIWVGTGENNSSRSSYGGLGVFRSDDAGETWRETGLRASDRIGRVLIDPRDGDRVFVAALGKLYTEGGERGVYRTIDGGESWVQVLPGGDWTGAIDLAFKPDDPDTVYAATWERERRPWDFVEGGDGSAIWKSTDGGDTWTRLGGGLPEGEFVGRIGLAVTAAAPDSVYAIIDNQEALPESEWDLGDRPLSAKRLRSMTREEFLKQDEDEVERFIRSSDLPVTLDAEALIRQVEENELTLEDLLDELSDANASLFDTDIRGLEVYRSDDAGATWRKTHDEPIDSVVYTYGYYFGQLRVSPADPDRLFALGVPIVASSDGGATWENVMPAHVHVDHHALWIDPEYPDRLLLGNDGGLDISYDDGKTWRKIDDQPVGQFYTVNVDLAEPYNVYGGLQDNGTMKCSSANEWEQRQRCRRINGGDGMYVAIDPRDNESVITGYQFGFYSRLGKGPRSEVRPRDELGEPALRYNWNSPVILSPHNPDIVYFGTNRVYRSMDQGESWTPISPDLTRSDERGDVPFATVTSLSESRLDFGLVWAGTDDGQVWVTETGGKGWTDVADRLPRDRWVSRVEASPHDRNRAFVTLNGYRQDDIRSYVYRTDDLGRRWREISDGLPAEPVNVIREDPLVPELLYVGTDRGVYVSRDGGDSWEALDSGLPNVPVHDLVVHPRDRELVAGTHGRSIWIADVLPLQDLAEDSEAGDLRAFYVDPIKAQRRWRGEPSRWFDRPENRPEVSAAYWLPEASSVTVEVVDGDDRVLQRWDTEGRAGLNRTTWDLVVDEAMALAAEEEDAAEADDPEHLSNRRYAESVRLGHRLYVLPGDYELRFTAGAETATTELEIKAPTPYKPRYEPAFSIRGRED